MSSSTESFAHHRRCFSTSGRSSLMKSLRVPYALCIIVIMTPVITMIPYILITINICLNKIMILLTAGRVLYKCSEIKYEGWLNATSFLSPRTLGCAPLRCHHHCHVGAIVCSYVPVSRTLHWTVRIVSILDCCLRHQCTFFFGLWSIGRR